MCTALTYLSGDFYMGRTLDYERGYGEEVVVTPRAYPFAFRHEGLCAQHYAIIGTACVADGYPLYYDAVNEKGLGMAGLNFVGNAAYAPVKAEAVNVAQFEFIPWLLGRCAGLAEARAALAELNLVGTPFSCPLPCRAAPLARGGPDGRARGRVHGGRAARLRLPGGRPDEQSALPHPAFRPEPLHGPLAASAGESIF